MKFPSVIKFIMSPFSKRLKETEFAWSCAISDCHATSK